MTLTLAEILLALPGSWQRVTFKSTKTPPQRERAELALDDHLTLALEVTTHTAQLRRLGIVGWDAPPLHDPCPVAWLLQPDLFALEPCRIAVETESDLTRGHTAVEFREGVAGARPHRWAVSADADRIFALIAGAVRQHRTI